MGNNVIDNIILAMSDRLSARGQAVTEEMVKNMYALAHRDFTLLGKDGDDDFSFAIIDVSRFRCNAYLQRGSVAAVCRIGSVMTGLSRKPHAASAATNRVITRTTGTALLFFLLLISRHLPLNQIFPDKDSDI